MATGYKKISGRRIRKGGNWNSPFFIEASIAVRRRDNRMGLLLQHQQKVGLGSRKQGASFFVRQRDIARFLRVVRRLLKDRSCDLDSWCRRQIEDSLSRDLRMGISTSRKELGDLERRLEMSQDSEEIRELKEQLAAKDREIAELSTELNKARLERSRIRLKEMERSVPEFKRRLHELRRLIDEGQEIAKSEGKKLESLYQDFLEENFWMFGMPYICVKGQRRSNVASIPDLLLQRADGFNDVVELENPIDTVFIERSGRYEQSAALKEALAQIMDYLDDYAVRYPVEYYEAGLDTYKAKGIVVIGRSGTKELERRRRQLNSYLHGIEIWTYDDLIRNAERVIDLLERGPMARMVQDSASAEQE